MFAPSLSAEQQRDLSRKLTSFLSLYSRLSDSFVIEFFTEDLWLLLPVSWQRVLQDLTYPQIADLLLDAAHGDRKYSSVWPLSLLAFRSTAHALAFPRLSTQERGGTVKPDEFLENQSQSSLLGHVFRKHVKPKKQHEIRRLGQLVKRLCDQTDCHRVVDVGSGQGHLTRFLSFGLGLSVTAVEADVKLVATATKFDGQLVLALEKEKQKKASSLLLPKSSPRHVAGWVNPKASWEMFIKQLSAPCCVSEGVNGLEGSERVEGPGSSGGGSTESTSQQEVVSPEGPGSSGGGSTESTSQQEVVSPEGPDGDFVLTGLHACGDLSSTLLRHFVSCPHVLGITSVACCYMKITTREDPSPPGLVEPQTPDQDGVLFGFPMSSWVSGLPGHQLSYRAREGACHAVEDFTLRLREESQLLKSHCYRAALETFITEARPDLRRAGIQTGRKSHLLPFTEYARLGLACVGLPPDLVLDPERVEVLMQQQVRVVVYFSLVLLLAPVVETLVLLDRMIYLQENGVDSQLLPLFNPNVSPRNLVLVALKRRSPTHRD